MRQDGGIYNDLDVMLVVSGNDRRYDDMKRYLKSRGFAITIPPKDQHFLKCSTNCWKIVLGASYFKNLWVIHSAWFIEEN